MKRGPYHRTKPTERECSMAADYRDGKTLNEIGTAHGVTRERVRQILHKWFGIRAKDGGEAVQARRRKISRDARRDERSLRRWGCTYAQYAEIRSMFTPTRAYSQQRKNAQWRDIPWELTLWQWWTIWQESGRWKQRGRGNGYMMCRKGDVGPYSVDNVFIARGIINSSEGSKRSDLPIGVSQKRGRFTAKRQLYGRMLHLGTFATADAAHAAYLAADPMQVAA